MSGLIKGLLAAALVFVLYPGSAQDRAALEQKRQRLEEQIRQTNSLLRQSRTRKETTVASLQALQAEIRLREEVVRTLNQEVNFIEREIRLKEKTLDSLSTAMARLQVQQGAQMRKTYIESQMSHPLLFVFSASNINDVFLRWQYHRHLRHARGRIYTELRATADLIAVELHALDQLRRQKNAIAADVKSQEAELSRSADEARAMIKTLESDEQKLRTQLNKQQEESKQLAAEIERIIAAEIRRSADADLPAAPAMRALSADFAGNKGRLPWPVDQGVITGRFGTQPHPIVRSISISNNGIDITAPPGSRVRPVFGGKVVGRKFIPGFDHLVIIQHGKFYTVYSRLAEVNVQINDTVTPQTTIGRLARSRDENPRLHLEIWDNKVKLDPEQWLLR